MKASSVIQQAVRTGLDLLTQKQRVDPRAAAYEKLKPSDFKKLIQKYGETTVLSYIKAMEAKRIKDAKTNNP